MHPPLTSSSSRPAVRPPTSTMLVLVQPTIFSRQPTVKMSRAAALVSNGCVPKPHMVFRTVCRGTTQVNHGLSTRPRGGSAPGSLPGSAGRCSRRREPHRPPHWGWYQNTGSRCFWTSLCSSLLHNTETTDRKLWFPQVLHFLSVLSPPPHHHHLLLDEVDGVLQITVLPVANDRLHHQLLCPLHHLNDIIITLFPPPAQS